MALSRTQTRKNTSIIMPASLLAHLKVRFNFDSLIKRRVVKKKPERTKKSKQSKGIKPVGSNSHHSGAIIPTSSTINDDSNVQTEEPLADLSTPPGDDNLEAEQLPAGPVDLTKDTQEANERTVIAVDTFDDDGAEAMIHPAFREARVVTPSEPVLLPIEQCELVHWI
jgi:hypothetical protein